MINNHYEFLIQKKDFYTNDNNPTKSLFSFFVAKSTEFCLFVSFPIIQQLLGRIKAYRNIMIEQNQGKF